MEDKKQIEEKLRDIELHMQRPDFWDDKEHAQSIIAEYNELKDAKQGIGKYDSGDAVLTVFAGAGGDDAEDFARILFEMYTKYIQSKNWNYTIVHEHQNDNGGYRNISIDIEGSKVYGNLKNESGVHRLVRISPFNAKSLRHTSFAMIEVVPKFKKTTDVVLRDEDIKLEFAKSGGPGGQNVNKRETAVRIVHLPTNLSVNVSSQRSQAQNKEKALEILQGKLYLHEQEKRKKIEAGLSVSSTTSAEWGSQIRSYVLHPYQMVKDHRTGAEVRDVDAVLNGDINTFITAEKDL